MRRHRAARALGWFSIGLGVLEMLVPHRFTRALGLDGHEKLVAGYGTREIATGIGLLAARDPTPWLWGRVAGDALDLGTLAATLHPRNPRQDVAGLAFAAVLGVAVADVLVARNETGRKRRRRRAPDYSRRSGLPRPPAQMRGAARDFEVPRDFRIPDALRPFKAA